VNHIHSIGLQNIEYLCCLIFFYLFTWFSLKSLQTWRWRRFKSYFKCCM